VTTLRIQQTQPSCGSGSFAPPFQP
jgi:hypothetical protein